MVAARLELTVSELVSRLVGVLIEVVLSGGLRWLGDRNNRDSGIKRPSPVHD